ncbi:hypothetical protein PENTCL1PPCAC_28553, partial [Pristionchus entomophagus]
TRGTAHDPVIHFRHLHLKMLYSSVVFADRRRVEERRGSVISQIMVTEGRLSARRAALKRQRALGSKDTQAAMKVLERYCKKKYRQSVIFAGIGSEMALNDPHTLGQEPLGTPISMMRDDPGAHYHSEPFTPRNAVDRNFHFPEPSTAFSCPAETKHSVHPNQNNQFAFNFGEHKLKDEIKYHKGYETWSSYLWRVFKFLYDYLYIKHFLLLFLMVCYALAGGYMFYSIEAPAEVLRDEERVTSAILRSSNFSQRVLDLIYLRCDILPQKPRIHGDPTDASMHSCEVEIAQLFRQYDDLLRGYYGLDTAWKWDFWNAVFYSGTIFTTIGYGNISCRTVYGRIATCAYALFGVPLMLVVLNSMGRGLFCSVQAFWEYMRRFVRGNFRKARRRLSRRMKKRVSTLESVHSDELETKLATLTKFKNDLKAAEEDAAEEEDTIESQEQDLFETFPMTLALLTVFLYISLCSWLFCYWEDWDYSTAFYFFFISLSTVGLGDEMPNHPKRACAFFLFFIVGLALVSMCISILQVKVENQYMAALQLIDQEHQAATIAQEEVDDEEVMHIDDEQLTRPEKLPALPDQFVRWRSRQDSRGSELSSYDRQTRTSSQIFMSSPSSDSPMCPPPVLGVFMARSISTRRPTSIIMRSDSIGSILSRRTRPVSSARSQEDLLLSPTSPKMAARAAEVESPTGPAGSNRAASPLSSPRAAASLAVITEDLDEEVLQTPVAKPALKKSSCPPLEVPEVRIESVEEVENQHKKDTAARKSSTSLASSLSADDHRF